MLNNEHIQKCLLGIRIKSSSPKIIYWGYTSQVDELLQTSQAPRLLAILTPHFVQLYKNSHTLLQNILEFTYIEGFSG
jgi:hypothetical protein